MVPPVFIITLGLAQLAFDSPSCYSSTTLHVSDEITFSLPIVLLQSLKVLAAPFTKSASQRHPTYLINSNHHSIYDTTVHQTISHPPQHLSMNLPEAGLLKPFAYVFIKHTLPSSVSHSPTRSQSQSHASSPTRSDGSTTSNFGVSTRDKTKALLCGQCFHCEMKPGPYSPMDVCHVIPKKSADVITASIFLLPSKLTSSFSNSTPAILRTDSSTSPWTMLLTACSSTKTAISCSTTLNPVGPSCLQISTTLYNSKRKILIDGK